MQSQLIRWCAISVLSMAVMVLTLRACNKKLLKKPIIDGDGLAF